jgi:RNA polymerase sigma-70 factor (ECF subfamily)
MSLRLTPVRLHDGFEKTLNAARQGERSQLGALLNVYRRYLLKVASEKLPQEVIPKAAPSDLVQETLFHACRAFDGFRGSSEEELQAWLNRILTRKIVEVHRYYRGFAKRDISREIRLSDVQTKEDTLGSSVVFASPMELAGKAETSRSLVNALTKLNEEQQAAIRLRSIDQLSFEEVGHRLGRSADSAQKLWVRAVRNLTRALHFQQPGIGTHDG